MVWLIEGDETSRLARRYGWRRVVVSQLVWERCVAVPEGVKDQREGDRLWDLFCFLEGALGFDPDADRRVVNRVNFYAGVVNDNRHEREDGDDDGRDWPTTKLSLVVRTAVAGDGSACLVVTFRGERRPR